MATSVPNADVLLRAALRYLERDLLPTLDGFHRFQTRVSVNALRTVERELRLRGSQRDAEGKRLASLLGHDGDVDAMNVELAEAIRHETMPIDRPGLASHLRASLREALAINNPKWVQPTIPE